jgi:hypothetical protein
VKEYIKFKSTMCVGLTVFFQSIREWVRIG